MSDSGTLFVFGQVAQNSVLWLNFPLTTLLSGSKMEVLASFVLLQCQTWCSILQIYLQCILFSTTCNQIMFF